MDTTIAFLSDLTMALVAATVGGALARALRVTPVLGYLAAGIALGPFTPGYVAHGTTLSGLSELGLIFLLFSLGLGFSVNELRAAGWLPMAGNLSLMGVFAIAAWGVGKAFGFEHPLTLGLAVTLSSTAIGASLLEEFGLHERRAGHLALALLIAQDLVAVALLVITTTPAENLTPVGIVVPLVKAVAFVAVALVAGATLLHALVFHALRRAPADLLVGIFSAIALAAAWLGHMAGLSFAFGAFVAGAVTSEAAGSRAVQAIIAPFRELFVMVFFVSVGMLIDVRAVVVHWPAVLALGGALTIVRIIGWAALFRALGWGAGTAASVGVALLPLGEFNLVLANASYAAKRLADSEMASFMGATLGSIVLAAVLVHLFAPLRERFDAGTNPVIETFREAPQVLIVGYGRVGRTAAAVLRKTGISLGVIELDRGLVELAREEGAEALYGDGSDPRTLERLISSSTKVVLTTMPDSAANAAIARRLSALAGTRIVTRASHDRDAGALRDAGAAAALVPETEGALRFAEVVLAELGIEATAIDELVAQHRGATSTELR